MPNVQVGATGMAPTSTVGTTTQTQRYLHPLLESFLHSLPNLAQTVQSHPQYQSFASSHPANGAALAQPPPTTGPNASPPIGSSASPPSPQTGGPGIPPNFSTGTPPPISSGVVAGPAAINHVPYGPELTGMDQLGGLITPNGTPVPASEWQLAHLDPTSLANYQDYAGSIAGVNPADLKQQSDLMTGSLNENAPTIKAPIKFDMSNNVPTPSGSGG